FCVLALTALTLGTIAIQSFYDSGGWCLWGGWRGHHVGEMRNMMERYDTNKDGKVTQQEIDDNRTEWFNKFDADKNGSLSLKEFEALWLEAHRQEMVREFQRLWPHVGASPDSDRIKGPPPPDF